MELAPLLLPLAATIAVAPPLHSGLDTGEKVSRSSSPTSNSQVLVEPLPECEPRCCVACVAVAAARRSSLYCGAEEDVELLLLSVATQGLLAWLLLLLLFVRFE